jgi:O-antigen ligase
MVLKKYINFINDHENRLFTVYLFLIIFFLPISVLFNYVSPTLTDQFNFFYFSRLILIIYSLLLITLYKNNYKPNYNLLLILILNFIYIFNYNFGYTVDYDYKFSDKLQIISSLKEDIFHNKNKYNIISASVILCSIIPVFFHNKINEDFFSKLLKLLLFIFIALVIFNSFVNFKILINGYKEFYDFFSQKTVNVHQLLIIPFLYFNIFFIKTKKFKFIELILLTTCLFIIILFKSKIYLYGLLFFLVIALFFEKNFSQNQNIKRRITKLLVFFLIGFLLINIIYKIEIFNYDKFYILPFIISLENFDQISLHSLRFSIDSRLDIWKYYLENFTHGNKIIGNSIYNNNLPTYPHNIFIDILYCTGVLGLSLFFFLISKILLNVRKIYNKNRLLFLIFIQLSYVSFFSGFFFVNIPLIMILALLIRFIGDSDFIIK